MEIWAKSLETETNQVVTLRKHVEDLINAIERFPFEKLTNFSPEEGLLLKKLLRWASFFHDLGKVSPEFQKRIGNTNFKVENFPQHFPRIRHNILSLFFIDKDKVREICENNETIYTTFLSAIAFHHWKVDEKKYLLHINKDLLEVSDLLLEDKNGDKIADILRAHFDNFEIEGSKASEYIKFDKHLACQLRNRGSLSSVGVVGPYTLYFLPERISVKIRAKINLNFWVLLAGFLQRADHFVSLVEKGNRIALGEFEISLQDSDLEQKLKEKFGEKFWQKDATKLKNRNLVLVAPTGIGKTEFALLWAEGNKVFYTLPIRTATNQIFERACGYYNKKMGNDEDPFINGNVGLLHSDADLYLLEKSSSFTLDEDGETFKILDLARHFSLPVNICTGDQIFPAALKYPQYEKTYATLAYSKLIIDEVQAYDPVACGIIVKMIEDVVSLGGKFLLITATLPEFVVSFLKERGIIGEDDIINLYKPDNQLGFQLKVHFRHKLELKKLDIENDIDSIINIATEGKRVLVVLNTVEKAEKIFKSLNQKIGDSRNITCDLIHSRFTLNQRREIEKDLQEKFKNPKPLEEKIGRILVATQVIEASLDIDADYLFTEIAPIDSLIQRMGRVMRRVDILTNKIKNTGKDFKYEDFYENSQANVYIYYEEKIEQNTGARHREPWIKESGAGRVYKQELLRETLKAINQNRVSNFELNEDQKQNLVAQVYRNLEKSSYIGDYYNTISTLLSGYVSENKDEAHRIFREIYSLPLIDEKYINDIAQKITDKLENQENITWLWFKKEIVAQYVINESMWRCKEYELMPLWNPLYEKLKDFNPLFQSYSLVKDRIKKYCEGIWVLKSSPKNEDRII